MSEERKTVRLTKAQAQDELDAKFHASIVHGLRSQGWSREAAIYEADERMSRTDLGRTALQESER